MELIIVCTTSIPNYYCLYWFRGVIRRNAFRASRIGEFGNMSSSSTRSHIALIIPRWKEKLRHNFDRPIKSHIINHKTINKWNVCNCILGHISLRSYDLFVFTLDIQDGRNHLLLDQGYEKSRLIRSLKKFIFRYQDLVEIYSVSAEKIISDAFSYSENV